MRTSSSRANHVTAAETESIVADYKSGMPLAAIAAKHGYSRFFIQSVAKRSGLPARGEGYIRVVISRKIEKQVVALYKHGKTTRQLAKRFRLSSPYITRILQANGNIGRRNRSQNRRVYRLNENVFDRAEANQDAAYWIGFIMADGYISHAVGASNLLSVTVSEIDRLHAYRFRRFLGSNRPIRIKEPHTFTSRGRRYTNRRCYHVDIQSRDLVRKIEEYGVTERKSLTAKVVGLEGNRHFWRGVVDGDGSITTTRVRHGIASKGAALRLCGSAFLLEQFKTFLQSSLPGVHVGTTWANGVWSVRISGRSAGLVARLLYDDCKTYLPRKSRLAKTIAADSFMADRRFNGLRRPNRKRLKPSNRQRPIARLRNFQNRH